MGNTFFRLHQVSKPTSYLLGDNSLDHLPTGADGDNLRFFILLYLFLRILK